jgi:hypothetical protein
MATRWSEQSWSARQKQREARRKKRHGVLVNPETGKRYTLCGRAVRTADIVQAVNCHRCRVRISHALNLVKGAK